MSRWAYLVQPLNRVTSHTDKGMSLSHQCSPPADSPQPAASLAWKALAVGAIALCLFSAGISSKPFADEHAYMSQSYYADLFFTGQFNDKLWLEGFAADLQPLPKFLIGLMFRSANLPMPTPVDAAAWYRNYQPFGTEAALISARVPTIALGALCCVSLFGCGLLFKDWRVGAVAAALLMINPVFSLHAHRAMSDVPCEAFLVTGLLAGLWAWKETWSKTWGAAVLVSLLAGLCLGLSLLCKFNGFLGLAIVVGWLGMAWLAQEVSWVRKIAITALTIVTIAMAVATLVALNPYLTAHPRLTAYQSRNLSPEGRALLAENPWQRFQAQLKLRGETSNHQRATFHDDALFRVPDRAKVLLVQGLGRFGPLGPAESDSTVRFQIRQDWGLIVWAPLIVFGLLESVRLARAQLKTRQAPTGAALLIWVAVPWIVLAAYLPMAWDRYQLPLQTGHALLGGMAAVAIWDRRLSRLYSGAKRG
jgi:4-amino-4-deoxy-L-arabinose transferase-like glycosyltransferase